MTTGFCHTWQSATPATGAEQGISGTLQAVSQPQRASCYRCLGWELQELEAPWYQHVFKQLLCFGSSQQAKAWKCFLFWANRWQIDFDPLINWRRENESNFSLLSFCLVLPWDSLGISLLSSLEPQCSLTSVGMWSFAKRSYSLSMAAAYTCLLKSQGKDHLMEREYSALMQGWAEFLIYVTLLIYKCKAAQMKSFVSSIGYRRYHLTYTFKKKGKEQCTAIIKILSFFHVENGLAFK